MLIIKTIRFLIKNNKQIKIDIVDNSIVRLLINSNSKIFKFSINLINFSLSKKVIIEDKLNQDLKLQ